MVDQGFVLITIDGGAATGKSSTASALADEFGYLHADTGSHYRALTKRLLDKGISPSENEELTGALSEIQLETRLKGFHTMIEIDGNVYSGSDIRADAVNEKVSLFAALPTVRDKLLSYQRSQKQFAQNNGFQGMIMEGRDIGSVIFPEADLRIFLSADTQTRITRRAQQGEIDQIEARDRQDSGRKTAPLVKPEGAMEIDTGEHSLEGVVYLISCQIKELLKQRSTLTKS